MSFVSHFAEADAACIEVTEIATLTATAETASNDATLELWNTRCACEY